MTGVSIRALHHYDAIGLLKPTAVTASGYRLYDDRALERLQTILLFRELQFPLKEIRKILDSEYFDQSLALEQQIRLLELQKAHIEKLLALARDMLYTGGKPLNFTAFDKQELENYAAQAKAAWGDTAAFREYSEKSKDRSEEEQQKLAEELMEIFRDIGAIREKKPDSPEAQALVERLRKKISHDYYNCTPEILKGLGQMYAAGGKMTENIDKAGGPGTASFAQKAIDVYCGSIG